MRLYLNLAPKNYLSENQYTETTARSSKQVGFSSFIFHTQNPNPLNPLNPLNPINSINPKPSWSVLKMLDAGRPARFSCWKIPELGLRRGLGFRGLRAYRAYRVYKVERVGCRGLRVQKPKG